MDEDPFDSLLGLEDKFYDEGYQLGVADGQRAGHLEGRVFGIEKGFEKYTSMGRLHGRSAVWAGRLQLAKQSRLTEDATGRENLAAPRLQKSENGAPSRAREEKTALSRLPNNPRLEKHIQTLSALVEPASLSTQNTEDSVSDFDDRFKRAGAKVKVIEKLIGEAPHEPDRLDQGGAAVDDQGGNIEDVNVLHARH
ncbi:MAG: hypothetical protein M1819_005992 [Sarea resinae]|nr:MAG: hypothetical protein M1819_005992 [Sarea resinae]